MVNLWSRSTLTTLTGQEPANDPIAMASTSGSAAVGSASLQARPWGTAISLYVRGLPPDTVFRAVAVAADGRREPAATWSSTHDGRAVVDGATSISRTRLIRLDVVTATGEVLLTAPG